MVFMLRCDGYHFSVIKWVPFRVKSFWKEDILYQIFKEKFNIENNR